VTLLICKTVRWQALPGFVAAGLWLGRSGSLAQDQDLGGLPGFIAPRQPQPGGRTCGQEKDESKAYDRRSLRPGGRESNSAGQGHGRGSRHPQPPAHRLLSW
jgi:hypothetical protein